MKNKYIYILLIILLTGCSSTTDKTSAAADQTTCSLAEPQNQKGASTHSENIILAPATESCTVPEDRTALVVDAGDSRILESTIDQITEQLER